MQTVECTDGPSGAVPQLTDLVRALAPPAAGGHSVLGWFVRRSGTWLAPSVRDRAVCAALPSLLALLSPGQVRAPLTCRCEPAASKARLPTRAPAITCSGRIIM